MECRWVIANRVTCAVSISIFPGGTRPGTFAQKFLDHGLHLTHEHNGGHRLGRVHCGDQPRTLFEGQTNDLAQSLDEFQPLHVLLSVTRGCCIELLAGTQQLMTKLSPLLIVHVIAMVITAVTNFGIRQPFSALSGLHALSAWTLIRKT